MIESSVTCRRPEPSSLLRRQAQPIDDVAKESKRIRRPSALTRREDVARNECGHDDQNSQNRQDEYHRADGPATLKLLTHRALHLVELVEL